MNIYQTLLVIYALGAVVLTLIMYWALTTARKIEGDNEAEAILKQIDQQCESTGLRDSGFAVLSGLCWPWVLYKAAARKK